MPVDPRKGVHMTSARLDLALPQVSADGPCGVTVWTDKNGRPETVAIGSFRFSPEAIHDLSRWLKAIRVEGPDA